MSEYDGPERRRADDKPSTDQVLEAVKLLSQQYEANSEANRKLAKEVGRRKRESRWIALGAALVAAIIVVGGLVVRHNDNAREEARRAMLASQVFSQRESQVQGCERANDGRRTLAEVIARAVQPSPASTSTDPALRALIEQSRERAVILRAELLALPGVQLINCQAAYPPVGTPRK